MEKLSNRDDNDMNYAFSVNAARNELINILLENSIDNIEIEE